MSISDRNVNFRASEATLREIADIQGLFAPFLADRSSTLRWVVRKFWELLFTDTNLTDVLRDWQVFSRKTPQHEKQLKFVFHEQAAEFFPRINREAL